MTHNRPAKMETSHNIVNTIHVQLARQNVYPVDADAIAAGHRLATELIGPNIATPEVLQRVHDQTGAGVFIARENGAVTGVLALILLSEAGRRAVEQDRFDASDPDDSHVAHLGQEPTGLYAWGMASTTLRTSQRLIESYIAIDTIAVPHLDCFGRPATRAGERLMTGRLKFKPVEDSRTGVVCRRAPAHTEAVAA